MFSRYKEKGKLLRFHVKKRLGCYDRDGIVAPENKTKKFLGFRETHCLLQMMSEPSTVRVIAPTQDDIFGLSVLYLQPRCVKVREKMKKCLKAKN